MSSISPSAEIVTLSMAPGDQLAFSAASMAGTRITPFCDAPVAATGHGKVRGDDNDGIKDVNEKKGQQFDHDNDGVSDDVDEDGEAPTTA